MRISRRILLGSGAVIGGGLVLGFAFAPNPLKRSAPGVAVKDEILLNTWVKITPDNIVTVIVPHAEMGQGAHTGLPMMLAEEMEADWDLVRMEEAPAVSKYANNFMIRGFLFRDVPAVLYRGVDFATFKMAEVMGMQITGGSSSARFTGDLGMRVAGAAAKGMLVKAAAKKWKVDPSSLVAKKSRVLHQASGREASYGALASEAALSSPEPQPKLKDPADFALIGTSVARFDIPSKVDGRCQYSIDTKMPGLLYAAIKHAPVFGGTVESFDETAVTNRRGVVKVVTLGHAVAVVADNTWRAQQALKRVPVTFSEGENGTLSSEQIFNDYAQALKDSDGDKKDRKQGDVNAALSGADHVIEAAYRVPLLAHAPLEPLNCTAHVNGKTCRIWTGSQAPLMARNAVAKALDIDAKNVTFYNMMLGGGFGRRLEYDYIVEAAQISNAVQAPVKLTWSREEDMQHDKYRPAQTNELKAVLGTDGFPTAWSSKYVSVSQFDPAEAPLIPYAIPNQYIRGVKVKVPVPIGSWRSVAHSQQSFFKESFLDELAHAAGKDPLDYRLRLLNAAPRHKAVLALAKEKSGWGTPLEDGRARGVALEECFGSIVAEVAEASLDDDGQVKVHKVTAVVDCGRAVNPGVVKAQIEGGIIFGLTAALYGNIQLSKGRVVQRNFPDYKMVRLADAPVVDVHILDSGAELGGVGEPGVPPVAPAVANAVFVLTGQRVRALPLSQYKFKPRTVAEQVGMPL